MRNIVPVKLLSKLRNLGVTAQMIAFEKRSQYIYNYILLVLIVISIIYAIVPYVGNIDEGAVLGFVVNIALMATYVSCLFLNRAGKILFSRVIFGMATQIHVLFFTVLFGWGIGNYLYYLVVAAAPYILFPNNRLLLLGSILTAFAGFFASLYLKQIDFKIVTELTDIYDILLSVAFVSSFALIFLVVRLLFHLARESEGNLDLERKKTERLLLNVLPEEIANRLQAGEGAIADQHENVAVLFADIVGFTEMSEKTTADRVVQKLNQVLSLLDILVEKYNLEKIKTIGDAYMVAAGIPQEQKDGLENIARFAIEAMALAQGEPGLVFRMGLDFGPVTAGVIGTKKFIYDLWGDTVNTASRMESHGEPGKIQVTERVVKELQGKFVFEGRGAIAVKGKGLMQTFFLTAK